MDHKLLFFFAAIGVFNALVVSAYYLTSRGRAYGTFLFGLLLLLLGVRAGVSCFHFFDKEIPRWVIQLGLNANVFSGLVLWFLIKGVQMPQAQETLKKLLVAVLILLVLFNVTFPFESHSTIWDHKIRYVLHSILAFLLALSFLEWYRGQKEGAFPHGKMLRLLFFLAVLLHLGFVVSLFTNYVIGPIWFSLVFFVGVFLFTQKGPSLNDALIWLKQKPSLTHEIVQKITRDLEALKQRKVFLNPDLKLDDLAKEVKVSRHLLSRFLNDHLGKGFSNYINELRVEESKKVIDAQGHLSLEAIGYEVGFRSKSTFFSFFKKVTGKTPSEYRRLVNSPGL